MATDPKITSETGAIAAARTTAGKTDSAAGATFGTDDLADAIADALKGGSGAGDGGDKPKPPPDPYAPVIRSFFGAYYKLWGTLPPPGYVEKRAREMNLYEFLEAERKKPAFRETKTYRDEAARFSSVLDRLLGYY